MARKGTDGMRKLSGLRKLGTLAALAATLPLTVSCFGHFPMTRAVYEFNNTIPTGILRNFVFWGFLIIPVYEVSMVVDAIIFNLLEFWLPGRIDDAASPTVEDGKAVVLTPSADGRQALLTVSEDGNVVAEMVFVKVSGTRCEVRDTRGKLLGAARLTRAGDVELSDARGRVVQTVGAAELAELGQARR